MTGGSGQSTGSITIKSGQGSGTNTSTGNIVIDSGQSSGSGTAGSITIGAGNAPSVTIGRTGSTTVNLQGGSGINIGSGGVANTIQIGNTSGGVSQTINVGNNSTSGSSTAVTIGSTIGASPVTIQGGSGGVVVYADCVNYCLQVKNGSTAVLDVDTTNNRLGVGTATPGYAIDVQSGDINTSGVYREGGTNVGQIQHVVVAKLCKTR